MKNFIKQYPLISFIVIPFIFMLLLLVGDMISTFVYGNEVLSSTFAFAFFSSTAIYFVLLISYQDTLRRIVKERHPEA